MNRVLIVDDSLIDRKIISTYLHQVGLDVDDAGSTKEAREKLAQYQPNLIVLDVSMERKSGFGIYQDLKANRLTSSIPVIICTSKSTTADQMWNELLETNSYLAKPVDKQGLLNQVQQLIGSKNKSNDL